MFLDALRSALDAWYDAMLRKSTVGRPECQPEVIRSPRIESVESHDMFSMGLDEDAVFLPGAAQVEDRLGFPDSSSKRTQAVDRLSASEPSTPSTHGGLADAHALTKQDRDRPGASSAPGLQLHATDGGELGCGAIRCTTRNVPQGWTPPASRSSGSSVGAQQYVLAGRSTPLPHAADGQYWAKYFEWSRHGHAMKRATVEQSQRGTSARCDIQEGRPLADRDSNAKDLSLPAQRLPNGMKSIDPVLMQHLREAYDRATGVSEYSASRLGLGGLSAMSYGKLPQLVYGRGTPRHVAQDDDEVDEVDEDTADAELDMLGGMFEPTIKGYESKSDGELMLR